jgi:hypothetical protein
MMLAALCGGLVAAVVGLKKRARRKLQAAADACNAAEQRLAEDRAAHARWRAEARAQERRRAQVPTPPEDAAEVWEVSPDGRGQRDLQTQHESARREPMAAPVIREAAIVEAARELQGRLEELERRVQQDHRRDERRRSSASSYSDDYGAFVDLGVAAASYAASSSWGSSDDTSGGGGSFGGGGATVSFDD